MEYLQHSACFPYIPTPTCLHPGQVIQGTLPGLGPVIEMYWLPNMAGLDNIYRHLNNHPIVTDIPPLAKCTCLQD